MGVKEKALTAASSIASGDFLRMVTSAGAARKIDYSKLAKAIVEEYNGSTIAGSAQTLKAALDSLNSKSYTNYECEGSNLENYFANLGLAIINNAGVRTAPVLFSSTWLNHEYYYGMGYKPAANETWFILIKGNTDCYCCKVINGETTTVSSKRFQLN